MEVRKWKAKNTACLAREKTIEAYCTWMCFWRRTKNIRLDCHWVHIQIDDDPDWWRKIVKIDVFSAFKTTLPSCLEAKRKRWGRGNEEGSGKGRWEGFCSQHREFHKHNTAWAQVSKCQATGNKRRHRSQHIFGDSQKVTQVNKQKSRSGCSPATCHFQSRIQPIGLVEYAQ